MRLGGCFGISALVVSLFCSSWVLADTEIINFHLPLSVPTTGPISPSVDAGAKGGLLLYPNQPLLSYLSSSHPVQSLKLDTEDLIGISKSWTVRVSWPGSSPARIMIQPPTLSSPSSSSSSGEMTISASVLSPRMAHPLLDSLPWAIRRLIIPISSPMSSSSSSFSALGRSADDDGHKSSVQVGTAKPRTPPDSDSIIQAESFNTPVSILLEPLILGLIPASSLPSIVVILILAVGVGMSIPRLLKLFERIINSVAEDSQVRDRSNAEVEREGANGEGALGRQGLVNLRNDGKVIRTKVD